MARIAWAVITSDGSYDCTKAFKAQPARRQQHQLRSNRNHQRSYRPTSSHRDTAHPRNPTPAMIRIGQHPQGVIQATPVTPPLGDKRYGRECLFVLPGPDLMQVRRLPERHHDAEQVSEYVRE